MKHYYFTVITDVQIFLQNISFPIILVPSNEAQLWTCTLTLRIFFLIAQFFFQMIKTNNRYKSAGFYNNFKFSAQIKPSNFPSNIGSKLPQSIKFDPSEIPTVESLMKSVF